MHAWHQEAGQAGGGHGGPVERHDPAGYLVWNVTDGAMKRHAGYYSWETIAGAGTTAKVGFHGVTPTAQRANPNQAAATDLATVITLANELRAALVPNLSWTGGLQSGRMLYDSGR